MATDLEIIILLSNPDIKDSIKSRLTGLNITTDDVLPKIANLLNTNTELSNLTNALTEGKKEALDIIKNDLVPQVIESIQKEQPPLSFFQKIIRDYFPKWVYNLVKPATIMPEKLKITISEDFKDKLKQLQPEAVPVQNLEQNIPKSPDLEKKDVKNIVEEQSKLNDDIDRIIGIENSNPFADMSKSKSPEAPKAPPVQPISANNPPAPSNDRKALLEEINARRNDINVVGENGNSQKQVEEKAQPVMANSPKPAEVLQAERPVAPPAPPAPPVPGKTQTEEVPVPPPAVGSNPPKIPEAPKAPPVGLSAEQLAQWRKDNPVANPPKPAGVAAQPLSPPASEAPKIGEDIKKAVGDRGDLLAEIQEGVKLKPVTKEEKVEEQTNQKQIKENSLEANLISKMTNMGVIPREVEENKTKINAVEKDDEFEKEVTPYSRSTPEEISKFRKEEAARKAAEAKKKAGENPQSEPKTAISDTATKIFKNTPGGLEDAFKKLRALNAGDDEDDNKRIVKSNTPTDKRNQKTAGQNKLI